MTLIAAQDLTEVRTVQQLTVAMAIRLRVTKGIQVNRDYTPANLRKIAGKWLGKTYPASRRGLEQAGRDLYARLGLEWK